METHGSGEMHEVMGIVSRKRAMSKRLVFLDVQTADIIHPVVVKERCEGVGGAAIVRSFLKLGDRIRVQGEREEDGTLLARRLVVEQVRACRSISER